MNTLLTLLSKNSLYFKLNLSLTIILAVFLCIYTKTDCFIFLNSFHTQILSTFFQYLTFFGDGIFTLLVSSIILLFFKKHKKLAILLIVAYFVTGIFAQLLKILISAPRPNVYFTMHKHQFYIDTFTHSRVGFRSFPSGHSASAFAMATIFSTYFSQKLISSLALVGAILIGYSRIYLAHHFLIDVLGGAVIGVVFSSLSIVWFNALRLQIIHVISKQNLPCLKPWIINLQNSLQNNR